MRMSWHSLGRLPHPGAVTANLFTRRGFGLERFGRQFHRRALVNGKQLPVEDGKAEQG